MMKSICQALLALMLICSATSLLGNSLEESKSSLLEIQRILRQTNLDQALEEADASTGNKVPSSPASKYWSEVRIRDFSEFYAQNGGSEFLFPETLNRSNKNLKMEIWRSYLLLPSMARLVFDESELSDNAKEMLVERIDKIDSILYELSEEIHFLGEGLKIEFWRNFLSVVDCYDEYSLDYYGLKLSELFGDRNDELDSEAVVRIKNGRKILVQVVSLLEGQLTALNARRLVIESMSLELPESTVVGYMRIAASLNKEIVESLRKFPDFKRSAVDLGLLLSKISGGNGSSDIDSVAARAYQHLDGILKDNQNASDAELLWILMTSIVEEDAVAFRTILVDAVATRLIKQLEALGLSKKYLMEDPEPLVLLENQSPWADTIVRASQAFENSLEQRNSGTLILLGGLNGMTESRDCGLTNHSYGGVTNILNQLKVQRESASSSSSVFVIAGALSATYTHDPDYAAYTRLINESDPQAIFFDLRDESFWLAGLTNEGDQKAPLVLSNARAKSLEAKQLSIKPYRDVRVGEALVRILAFSGSTSSVNFEPYELPLREVIEGAPKYAAFMLVADERKHIPEVIWPMLRGKAVLSFTSTISSSGWLGGRCYCNNISSEAGGRLYYVEAVQDLGGEALSVWTLAPKPDYTPEEDVTMIDIGDLEHSDKSYWSDYWDTLREAGLDYKHVENGLLVPEKYLENSRVESTNPKGQLWPIKVRTIPVMFPLNGEE